jgi:hypothetical protein
MDIRIAASVFAFVLAVASARAVAAPVVEVVETDPPGDTELAPREAVYARVRYDSTVPFRVQARGYRAGVEQQAAMMNPSPVYPAGQGEAIAWLAFETGVVDELRVVVFDERWQPLTTASVPRNVLWSRTAAPPATRSPWVAALNAAQQSSVSSQVRAATPESGAGDIVLFQLVALSVPGYLLLQAFALWRRRGRSKRAELLPLLAMMPAFAFSALAYARDANLWPVWLLLLCPPAVLYLAIVLFARSRSARGRD